MTARIVRISAILAACLLSVGVHAGDRPERPNKDGERPHRDGERPHKDGERPDGHIPRFVLAHAAELSLSDEQKQKFEAVLKFLAEHRGDGERRGDGEHRKGDGLQKPERPEQILTDAQRAKLKELMADRAERAKEDRPARGDRPKGPRPDGDRK